VGARLTRAFYWPRREPGHLQQGAPYAGQLSGGDQVVDQIGRPDDGTDATGFFDTEYFVNLKPKDRVAPVFHQNKDNLIASMNQQLENIPGVIWGFSQPIEDNMEEAVSGVKGELSVKIYGDDFKTLEAEGQ
jgi:cobalt-zinc-cadmium resistance protein CzcA